MVCPDKLVTISPGLVALPLGRFSTAGMIPIKLTGNCKSATADKVPNTAAAPHISNFISSISLAGLIEMPPESKVTPLPTKTTGISFFLPPRYSRIINRGGCSLPLATANSALKPCFSK